MSVQKIFLVRRSFRVDGGAELALQTFAKSLGKIAEIELICQTWDHSKQDLFAHITEVAKSGLTRRGKYGSFIKGVRKAVERANEGILHSHEFVPGANVLRLGDGLHSSWVRRAGIRESWLSDGFHKFKVDIERECLTHPSLKSVIVNSKFIADELSSAYGFNSSVLIRNIVRDSFFRKPQKNLGPSNKLLLVGSGWSRKGLLVCIKALRLMPKATLHVFGEDKDRSKFFKAANELGVREKIHFHGVVDVTPELYDGALALIHPAIYEPFPNVATEALSRGVPVISTSASGSCDFSRDEGVWTFQGITDSDIRDAVSDIASLPSASRIRFRDHILQFDETYLDKKLQEIYSQLI